jgi:hypothetical protein
LTKTCRKWYDKSVRTPPKLDHVGLAALEQARYMVEVIQLAENEMAKAVATARAAGASWTQIGDALGMSRQAAHERFRSVEGD